MEFADLDPVMLPPVTRMVLTADGSTTRLLEALTGAVLAVEVVEQWRSASAPLPERVRTALGCLAGDEVVRRRSELRSAAGHPVSRNEVTVCCRDPELCAIFTDDRVPIGRGLDAARRVLGRTVLATGWTSWSGEGGEMDCVYKEYVLTDPADAAVAHIRERFNPLHVPARVR